MANIKNIPAPPKPGTDAYRSLPRDSMANGYFDTVAWNPEEKRWEKTSLLAAGNGNYITETTWRTRNSPEPTKTVTIDIGKNKTAVVDKIGLKDYLNAQLSEDPAFSSDSNKQAIAEWKNLGGAISDFFSPVNGKPKLSERQQDKYNLASNEQKISEIKNKLYGSNGLVAKFNQTSANDPQYDSLNNQVADLTNQLRDAKNQTSSLKENAKAYQTKVVAKGKLDMALSAKKSAQSRLDKILADKSSSDESIAAARKKVSDLDKELVTKTDVSKQADSTYSKFTAPVSKNAGTPKSGGVAAPVPGGSNLPKAPPVPGGSIRPPAEKPAASGTATGTDGVSKGKKTTPAPVPDKNKKKYSPDEIYSLLQGTYGPIDLTFKTDPDLQALLKRAIGADGIPGTKDDYNNTRFLNELQGTKWFQSTGQEVRQRVFYKNQYNELKKTLGPDQISELEKTSEYARGLTRTRQIIKDAAVKLGTVLNPDDLETIAINVYDYANETSGALVSAQIRNKITYKPGQILSGEAGVDLADLKATATANGIDLEKQFGTSLQGWLKNLAQGESVDTYKQIIRNTARIGLPERVSSLLDNGVDLNTIYDPYRKLMAATLEINPETITLNDSTLRMAVGPTSEMSLYDFQKTLKKDPRWQYSSNARDEISNITQTVLKDFGFKG